MNTAAVKRMARKTVASARTARMHMLKRAIARRALSALEASGRALSPQMRRQALDYAIGHLGWKGYAEWLQVYAAASGQFRPGWLPDNYYTAEVMPRVNGAYHHMARQRAANRVLFGDAAFPDIGYVVNGLLLDAEYRVVAPAAAAATMSRFGDRIVVKSDASGFGAGVRSLATRGLDMASLTATGNGVIQRMIEPHPFFDRFGLPSVPTLRIATVITDQGQAEVRGCYLKLGRKGHGHVMASDQLRIAVDWTSGRLADEGFMTSWRVVERHPDTGAEFAGLTLPQIGDCVQTALRLHRRMPLPRFLSWDMLPDRHGRVQVLEWEGGVVSFAEPMQGPCFADLGWDRLHLTGGASGKPGAAPTLIAGRT